MDWEGMLVLVLSDVTGWQKVTAITVITVGVIAVFYLKNMRQTLKSVESEFSNNGGSTMKDSLDRIEKMQEEHSAYLGDLAVRMVEVESKQNEKRKWFS